MMRLIVSLISLACARPPAVEPSLDAEFDATVRVIVIYADDSTALGTGVVVGPRHVLTARHVVHKDDVEAMQIAVLRRDGGIVEMVVDAESEAYDVARLVAVGVGEPFSVVATLGRQPQIGAEVCAVTAEWLMKCGRVSMVEGPAILVAVRLVLGNSGSPLYDSRGRVVGIVVTRRAEPEMDDAGQAVSVDALRVLWPSPPPIDLFPEMR